MYASERDYKLSNFYLKISLFLNKKFLPNKALLAENFYYQKQNALSKNIYHSLKSIGTVYSWHASKNIATILLDSKGKKYAVKNLEDEFNLLSHPNFEHYYELANFYKENEYYKESIKYYSLALNEIEKDHVLFPKLLDLFFRMMFLKLYHFHLKAIMMIIQNGFVIYLARKYKL